MVDQITSNDLLLNNTIRQQQDISGIEKKSTTQNPYAKLQSLDDRTEISDEALNLYQKDKEISKYKDMVLSSLGSNSGVKDIADLMESGKYQVSNDDLADSLMSDNNFVNMLIDE